MKSKTKKFFCVCAVIFLVGIVMTIIGIVVGGIDNISMIDKKFKYINFGMDTQIKKYDITNIDNINIDSDNMDIIFVKGTENKLEIYTENKIVKSKVETSDNNIKINCDYNSEVIIDLNILPEYTNHNNEIIITYTDDKIFNNISINDADDINIVDAKINNFSVTSYEYSDIYIKASNIKEYTASTKGEIKIENSEVNNIKASANNIYIDANILGNMSLYTDEDIYLKIKENMEKYKIEASGEEININGREYVGAYHNNNGGTNTMELVSSGSDIEIVFQNII